MKNKVLASIHVVLLAGYATLWLYFSHWYFEPAKTVMIILILVHGAAAYGAVQGNNWGRLTSKSIGILLLFGFPIGTVIGFLILSRLGANWKAAGQVAADVPPSPASTNLQQGDGPSA